MSFINKLQKNLPGYLLHIPDRLQGNMLKPKPLSLVEEAVVPILRLITTGGPWFEVNDYLYQETNEDGLYIYSLVTTGTDTKVFAENYDITYDPIGQVFDANGVFAPAKWKIDDLGGLTTAYPTASNMRAQHWYDSFQTLCILLTTPIIFQIPAEVLFLAILV